jgi:hypothetical protein
MQLNVSFGKFLEVVNQLSLAEHETLIEMLQRRLKERQHAELVQNVQTARQEFQQGLCQPATPSEIMRDILA